MREEAVESMCAALSINFCGDPDHQAEILKRFSEILNLKDELNILKEKSQRFQTFSLNIKPASSSSSSSSSLANSLANQFINLIVIHPEGINEQHHLTSGVWNKIDVGNNRQDVRLKFTLGNWKEKNGGESKKSIKRSASLLKKVGGIILSEKKIAEQINLSTIPIGANIKKSIIFECGKSISFEIKLIRNDHKNQIKCPEFDDFLEVTRLVHEWQAMNSSEQLVCYDGNLGDPTFSMLYSIAFFFEIPSFVLKVAEMICFLVWDDEKKKLDEKALIDVNLKMSACETEVDKTHQLLMPCLNYLNECTCNTIRTILDQMTDDQFFPPISHHRLKVINDSLKIVADVCVLLIWDEFPTIPSPATFLALELEKILIKSAENWAASLNDVGDLPKLCTCIQDLWLKMSGECRSSHIFFQQFDIDFIKICFSKIVENLGQITRDRLSTFIDSINLRNSLELENFTRLSMRLFVNYRQLKCLGNEFGVFVASFEMFETWFDNVPIFWTFSWRELTLRMVERTIRLDEDGDSVKYGARRPLPDGLYSFLCIQKGISDDLHRLELHNSKHLITCSISVVNILCQNIIAYGKKLFSEAMRSHAEKISRLIRATNGIEQAMCFVEEGHQRFAQFQRLRQFVDEDEFLAVQTSSQRLLISTRSMCEQQISTLLAQFVKLKKEIVTKIARNLCGDGSETSNGFTSYMREIRTSEKIEGILECSYGLVDDVRCLLLPRCFKIATVHFATLLEVEVRKYLKLRQPAEYYSNIYIAMKCIYEILEIEENKDVELLSNLHLNSFSTKDLILSYYDSLCEKVERTIFDEAPTVDVHISYHKMYEIEKNERISIQIKLIKMSAMEWIDILSDRVDYFVRFDLLPQFLFPPNHFDSPTTNPMPQTAKPQWNQLFEINLPLECFFTRGACLAISVFDHERFVDRLVGRGFISLHSVPESTDNKPSHRLRIPLLPFDYLDHSNIFYQLLKCRSSQDELAKEFIELRQKRHFRFGDISRYFRKNRNRVGHLLLG